MSTSHNEIPSKQVKYFDDGIFRILTSGEREVAVFSVLNRHFVLDVNSSNLFEVPEEAIDIVRNPKFWCRNLASSVNSPEIDELQRLIDSDELFTCNKSVSLVSTADKFLRNGWLVLTYDCNMSCNYCYRNTGKTSDFQHNSNVSISHKTGYDAIDFLFHHSNKNLSINFYGGEPLLCGDILFDLADYAQQRAHASQIDLSLCVTTNGLLLSNKDVDALSERDFSMVVSFDGPATVQNIQRPTVGGNASFNKVYRNLRYLATSPLAHKTLVRATFTKKSLGKLNEMLEFIYDAGFRNVSLEPACLPSEHADALTCSDIHDIESSFDKMFSWLADRHLSGHPLQFYYLQHFLSLISSGTQLHRSCGAGLGSLAIGPDGNIYACEAVVGTASMAIGDIYSGINEQLRKPWTRTVEQRQHCSRCWARHICGGGCRGWSHLFEKTHEDVFPFACMTTKLLYAYSAWYGVTIHRKRNIKGG